MSQFLHIRVEDIDLLLPALRVHEVLSTEKQNRTSEGHAIWRDQVIGRCDLGQVLQRCPVALDSRQYGVVYSPDESDELPILLLIDEVLGLRKVQSGQLHKLPGSTSSAHDWFDGFWIDNKLGLKAYCVKSQLAVGLFS